ncbi:DMT family transporter (plasmid) [Chondrinema litorale]|nr:DMT family transporter [Chondrinema litorale]UZR98748.1 DMT family transporter [Chondrinema litorale]
MFSRGVWYMLLAIFFFSTMGLLVKLISHIPATQIVFFRSIVSLTMSVAMLRYQKVSIWGNNKKYLILRGITGSIALILYFTTLQAIPFASAVTLGFMAPVFATVLGIFIAKEKVFKMQWVFFSLAFIGIYMVEGFDPRVKWWYFVIGLVASLFSGLAYNFIRKLNITEHPLVIIFYFPLITAPITGIYCYFVEWVPPTGSDLLMLILVGIVTQIAQFFMTKSLQLEAISKVTILRYLSIFFALSYGYIFFKETYDWAVYLGMVISIAGVILNLWYRNYRTKQLST